MRTGLKASACAVMMVLLLCSCSRALTIVHTSDIHYLSNTLVESPDFMEQLMKQGDGKAFADSVEIAEAFVNEVSKLKPDAVVISGDLTFNGEQASHEELVLLLGKLRTAGIKVFVIPGNHDLDQRAFRFTNDNAVEIESIDAQTYENLWWDFGYGNALYQDPMSNSYIAEIDKDTWLVALDTNTGLKGLARTSSLTWLEQCLKEAEAKGITLISTTHQNLFVHDNRFDWGYRINNSTKITELYERYNVRINLTGHLHLQNIVKEGNLTDIAVSSLCVTPLQYGILELKDGKYTYRTTEIKDKRLQERALEAFDSSTIFKFGDNPQKVESNRLYFKGTVNPDNDHRKVSGLLK